MFSEDEEKRLRDLLRQLDETRHLRDDEIGFSEVGLPERKESIFWERLGRIGHLHAWLGKSRGGKIVLAWLLLGEIHHNFEFTRSVIDWVEPHIIYPVVQDLPVASKSLSDFVRNLDAKLFPPSNKDKFLAFSNPVDGRNSDILIPANSGIIPEEIINRGFPPKLLTGVFNNSQQAANQAAIMHKQIHDQAVRNNARFMKSQNAARFALLQRERQEKERREQNGQA